MSVWNSTTSREGPQSVDFHRPPFRLPQATKRDPSAPNMTLIYPIDAVCVDMAERWRQLREAGRVEGQRLKAQIENTEQTRWERLCRRWASKHPER